MALDLKALQAKLLEQQAKKDRAKTGGNGFTGENPIYPFWNNPEASTAVLRFLPDGDETNDFFWLERLIIKLPFPGIKGQHDSKKVEVQVPCTDMWKPNSCPITAEIRPWWKDKSLEDMARKYYKKKSYLFQGFVVENPNRDDQSPENPIRRFIINPSVFDRIKSILLVQDIEDSPVDYDRGLDFYLVKTQKGQYANYDSSQWLKPGTMSLKTRSLSEQERGAINQYGLWNLSSFMPKKPDEDQLNAIMEMFHASVNEELYDVDRWGQFYRPTGMRDDAQATDTDTARSVVQVRVPTAQTTQPAANATSILSKLTNKTVATDEKSAPGRPPIFPASANPPATPAICCPLTEP